MDWPRLKTMFIVILLFVNVILGAVWGNRLWAAASQERNAKRELCALLADKNIIVTPEQITEERTYSYHWIRSPSDESAVAALLLGTVETERLGDTVASYYNDRGQAQFRMNGEFTFTAHTLPPDTLALMGQMSFGSGRGNATEGYTQLLDGLPIFRNVARLTTGGSLNISGRWYWGEALPVNGELCHTAGYSLLHLAERLNSPVPLTPDTIELGFLETQIEPEIILLTPFWRICFPDSEYYVNAVTAEVEGT